MLDLSSFRDRLQESLRGHVGSASVEVALNEYRKFEARIVSPDFEGMDDGDRQALVLGLVRQSFSPDERRRIDFLFTDAPSERPVPVIAQ